MVTDFIEGVSIAEMLQKEKELSEWEILAIIEQTLKVLDILEQEQIIHRDIKPDNILISDKKGKLEAFLIDFGIATYTFDNSQLRHKCGTPGYIDTYVLKGGEFSCKSDVFSLGCVFYFLLTKGEHLFNGKKVTQILFNN